MLNINELVTLSPVQMLERASTNLSSMSFTFLNYVVTKYFLFGILVITRLSDVFFVLIKGIFVHDPLLRTRLYKFKQFDYVT